MEPPRTQQESNDLLTKLRSTSWIKKSERYGQRRENQGDFSGRTDKIICPSVEWRLAEPGKFQNYRFTPRRCFRANPHLSNHFFSCAMELLQGSVAVN